MAGFLFHHVYAQYIMLLIKRIKLLLILFLPVPSMFAQNKMRTAEELINKTEPAWELVQGWIKAAKNKVEVLPCDSVRASEALYQTQVTTRSPMGAIIYSTGGLLIDNGWIRILGSGHPKLNRSLPEWNKGRTFTTFGENPPLLLVADDAAGGFFALNGGILGKDLGNLYYWSPDTLEWEALELTYSDFLDFCFNRDLNKFYKGLRWKNWKKEVMALDGNKCFNFYPPLWTNEGKDIDKNSRKVIPIEEQYNFNLQTKQQLDQNKKGK
jgi:hypothetical protein